MNPYAAEEPDEVKTETVLSFSNTVKEEHFLHVHKVKQEQLEEYAAEEPDEVKTETVLSFSNTVKEEHFLHVHKVKQEQLEEYAAEEPDEVKTETVLSFSNTVKEEHFLHVHKVKEEQLEEYAAEEPDERTENVEIPCPKCDKTFPSQNSFKIHLQQHNRQTALQNAQSQIYRYQCNDCGNFFKTSALLMRHACANPYSCEVCRKRCTSLTNLAIHKRSHEKEDLNKKIKTVPSSFSCRTCGKVCSSLALLNMHNKTHKEFSCLSCQETFPSTLALEKHIRESCAKAPLSHRRSMRVKSLCSPSTGENSAEPTTASLPSTPLPSTLLEVPTVWDAIGKTKSDW